MQPRARPDAAGATSVTRRASMRRGLTTYLRLSHGRLKRGRAAAPLLVAWRYPPSRGGTGRRLVTPWVCADRPPGPQRRTGSAIYGAADGPPFPLPAHAT